jgi:26S proteasome regulatory subunit N10
VAFVGSPILADDKAMEDLGKNLKKNSVSLDIISFGEVEENKAKLEKLLNAVNSNDSSHMLEVPVGPKLLSDVLLSSPIINPDGVPMGGMGVGGDGMDFGFNADDDPELAMALRISMEEDRARQAAQGGGDAPAGAQGSGAAAPAAMSTPAAAPPAADAAVLEALGMEGMEDMDDELRQALLLSLQESGGPGADAPAAAPASSADKPPEETKPVATPAAAPAVSAAAVAADAKETSAPTAPAAATATPTGDAPDQVDAQWFADPAFVQELLTSLPGVDIQDPRIQEALKEVAPQDGAKKDDDKKDDKK